MSEDWLTALLGVADDAIWTFEGILDEEDLDHDECSRFEGHDLCGARSCESNGCIVAKLARAREAVKAVRGNS